MSFFAVLDVISEWRTMRDNFVRSTKSGFAAKSLSHMSTQTSYIFLKNLELRETESTIADEVTNVNQDTVDENNGTVSENENEHHVLVQSQPLPKISKDTNNAPLKKNKKPVVEQVLIDFIDKFRNRFADDNIAFFYSLLPAVKTLTMNQKFVFRQQCMQFVQNLKNTTMDTRASH